MLSLLKEISFVRLIVPFCLGIVSYVFLPAKPGFEITLSVFLACCILLPLSRFIPLVKNNHRYLWFGGIYVFILFFLAGYLFTWARTEINSERHFGKHIQKDSKILLQINEPLVEKERSFKTTARVLAIFNHDSVVHVIGKTLIYLRKDSAAAHLRYGDKIIVKNKFAELPDPKNPREFNYKRFMGFKQVNLQIFLAPEDWLLSDNKGGCPFFAKTYVLRQYLMNLLQEHITDEQAFAVGSSLILGMREKLDDDLIKAYSSSGAMHVLAVSGLHVGIIYGILSGILVFLNRNTKSKILKSIILVLLIWVYATLTGLSASVMRSATMLTFVAIGTNLKRSANIYNILASSAFFMLLINPYFLMEVGFQLSYLAVAGIVSLQPRIYPLLYTRYWLPDRIWMITSVSIAAQIATFPIGLLYFYQFPVYFLVSNLFVIPAAMLILCFGIALFAIHWIPYVSDLAGFLLDMTLQFMNGAVKYIDSMPFALLQGISITVPESWFIYAIVSLFVAFLYYHRNSFLIASIIMLAMLLGWNVMEKVMNMQQQKLVVYCVPKTTAIDFISGTDHLFVADNALLNDYDRMLFHIKHHWWDSGLRSATADISEDFEMPFLKRTGRYIQFLDKRIVLINEDFNYASAAEKLKVDYLIIANDVRVKIEKLAEVFEFKKIIFDSSNSAGNVRFWKKDCERLEIDYYDVGASGAFVLDI